MRNENETNPTFFAIQTNSLQRKLRMIIGILLVGKEKFLARIQKESGEKGRKRMHARRRPHVTHGLPSWPATSHSLHGRRNRRKKTLQKRQKNATETSNGTSWLAPRPPAHSATPLRPSLARGRGVEEHLLLLRVPFPPPHLRKSGSAAKQPAPRQVTSSRLVAPLGLSTGGSGTKASPGPPLCCALQWRLLLSSSPRCTRRRRRWCGPASSLLPAPAAAPLRAGDSPCARTLALHAAAATRRSVR